ncbi:MAG TPA: pectate lyase [Brevundimonas sp.]|uniref:pectate lyase n=1 Tax=Brevundimonas sp. TaxID=1871086 RepID=UPI002BB52EF0|nr:pectate lyase [Brevundimonas sp.]HRH20629.1 pectate lyase [Brevundimonas sp.]
MILTTVALAAALSANEIPAFPGAEGAGRLAVGGRGGGVFHVTSLADSGPGTLREAIEARGPRTVVFDLGGTIRLETPLVIRHGQITLAGQTAPGGGITLRDQSLVVQADDVVIRYIRSRLGDESNTEADAISVNSGSRIILDHVSASWSVDETLSLGNRYDPPERGLYDVTVQWSLIAESLNESIHGKGAHGYGSLVRGGFGARFSFHHNLWAHHRARMPRPGNYNDPTVDPTGPLIEFRSNVFYNWGGSRAGYNSDEAQLATYAFIDNAYVRGPDSTRPIAFEEESQGGRAWFQGNLMDGAQPADPWSLVVGEVAPTYRLSTAPDIAPVTADPAASAYDRVLAGAGASLRRDSVDARIVGSVAARDGRLINTQGEVGGWPELATGEAWIDTDGDGMPDDWEACQGLDPADPGDGPADRDGDGYTNLEDWLNSLTR